MHYDIAEIIKNIQTLSENTGAFEVLKDFERVIDELDIYVFKNWEEGELCEGPVVNRYSVKCSFMWEAKEMPDPQGGKRLLDYGCKVVYKKTKILVPRKIKDPSDYRPGTKKGKIDPHPVWIVSIDMPKKLMQDIGIGTENKENLQMAEMMKYNQQNQTEVQPPPVESPAEAPAGA